MLRANPSDLGPQEPNRPSPEDIREALTVAHDVIRERLLFGTGSFSAGNPRLGKILMTLADISAPGVAELVAADLRIRRRPAPNPQLSLPTLPLVVNPEPSLEPVATCRSTSCCRKCEEYGDVGFGFRPCEN